MNNERDGKKFFEKYSDDNLRDAIARRTKEIEALKSDMELLRDFMDGAQAELDRRMLKEQGFVSGESVLITQEFIDHRNHIWPDKADLYSVGEMWIISSIIGGTVYIYDDQLVDVACPLEMAYRMRKAYLEREG